MNLRLIVPLGVVATSVVIASCSSGLGNNLPPSPTAPPTNQASTNAPVGLELGVELSDPAGDPVVAGVVVPAGGSQPERDVVLTVFTTSDAAGDGAATNVSRDLVDDSNGAADVFVAAVSAQDIDHDAFSQSLAGKFRHPRCVTCHSMTSATTTAFGGSVLVNGVPQTPPGFTPHAGALPGVNFPANNPGACETCHVNSTDFPVVDWKAPESSFDLRTESVAALNARAQIPPTGDLEHFKGDPRVLWALDSGILPKVGGRNGIADDDHDGVIEPTDTDGVIRTVPGGSAKFIEQIEAWEQAGFPATAVDAVRDVTLVSRRVGGGAAGNGASTRPQVRFVPNGAFAAPGVIGTLHIAYQSDATDLVAGDTNDEWDIFVHDRDHGTTERISVNIGGEQGNDTSRNPSISGDGQFVSFYSYADNLVEGDTNDEEDIFVQSPMSFYTNK